MGHGLNYVNVRPICRIPGVEELNIGHSIVARAVMVGMTQAVADMKRAITEATPERGSRMERAHRDLVRIPRRLSWNGAVTEKRAAVLSLLIFARSPIFRARKRSMAKSRFWIAGLTLVFWGPLAFGQGTEAVAARVNGQPIAETSVQRGLKRLPASRQLEARADIIDYLVANVLIDQYLLQRSVEITPAETAAKVDKLREELKKAGKEFEKVLQEMGLSEDELKKEVTADLRWEKYCTSQATDAILRDIFAKNLEMFDGTLVRARHILLKKESGPAPDLEAKLRQIRKQIEEDAAKESPKLDAIADQQARESRPGTNCSKTLLPRPHAKIQSAPRNQRGAISAGSHAPVPWWNRSRGRPSLSKLEK